MARKKSKKEERLDRQQRQGVSLVSITDPESVVAEQFRTIRTNIQLQMEKENKKIILFTSSGPYEGKSTVIANVAASLGTLDNMRVLLIDADMRKPTARRSFSLTTQGGLSTLLANRDDLFMQATEYVPEANLYVMPAGPTPPNPAELLSSKRMDELLDEMSRAFDIILIDTPPVLVVTDTQILANKVDGVVFVLREGIAQKQELMKAKHLLETTKASIIGAVYNGAQIGGLKSYYGYGYGLEDQLEEEEKR